MKSPPKRYTISDGKLVIYLEPDEDGGFTVTSPLDPEMVTQAESVPEAFEMARDAIKSLRQSRAKLMRRITSERRKDSKARIGA